MSTPAPPANSRATTVAAVAVLTLLALVMAAVVGFVVAELTAPTRHAEVTAVSGGPDKFFYEVRFPLPDGGTCVSRFVGGAHDARVGDGIEVRYATPWAGCEDVRPAGTGDEIGVQLLCAVLPLLLGTVVFLAWRRPHLLARLPVPRRGRRRRPGLPAPDSTGEPDAGRPPGR